MARGGRRAGKPGAAYGNRSDLNAGPRALPAAAATGQEYGQASAQMQAQRQVPVASGPLNQATPAPSPTPAGPPQPPPGSFGPLDRPSERPDEPLTAGAAFGPGPGRGGMIADPTGDYLRALYQIDANPDIRELIEQRESGGF